VVVILYLIAVSIPLLGFFVAREWIRVKLEESRWL
jgi:hypothetical protein